MILKMPTNCTGNNYGDTFELDGEDFDSVNEADGGGIQYENDFSEYLWMAEEEEFDKLEMQRLEEEALMEQCIEAMLDDEMDEEVDNGEEPPMQWSTDSHELCHVLSTMKVVAIPEQSTLNPLATEFVPKLTTTAS